MDDAEGGRSGMSASRLGILASLVLVMIQVMAPARAAAEIPLRPLKGLRADVAALVLNGREGGALHAAMLAAVLPPEGKSRIGLWIEIDGARLVGASPSVEERSEESAQSIRVEVHAYAMRLGGGLAGSLSQSFRLPAELVEVLDQGGIKYRASLEFEPGEYELRVLVRETKSQRYALRVLPLTVPSPGDDQAAVTPPFFPDVEAAWTVNLGPDLIFSPAVLPVLHAGRPLAAQLLIHGGVGREPRLVTRILDGQRQPLRKIDARLVLRQPLDKSVVARRYDLTFELPDDLLTGNYFLETSVEMRGRGSSPAQISTTQFYALGLERDESDVIWPDLQNLAALSARRRQALDLATERRSAKRVAAIANAYREVLRVLSTGSVAEAVTELHDLETEVLDSQIPATPAVRTSASQTPASQTPAQGTEPTLGRIWLIQAQDQVLAALAEADPESLVPVLFLHMEAHNGYIGGDRPILTFHARERVIATARIYAKRSESELAARLTAQALADMGGSLGRAGLRIAARRMWNEALALDQRNMAATLGVALDQEHRGEYHGATTSLRRLLEIDPASEEARLRLAVNLRRSGETVEAGGHLRRLLADADTTWVLSLAYQQLAENFLKHGRTAEAMRLLEEGLRRLPRQGRLHIQLIHALDLLGESRRAREVLERLVALGQREISPRLRYSRHIPGDPESSRSDLVRQSLARLTILSGALPQGKGKK